MYPTREFRAPAPLRVMSSEGVGFPARRSPVRAAGAPARCESMHIADV